MYNSDMDVFVKLLFPTFFPVIATVFFIKLGKTTFFNKIPEKVKQVIYGVTFGLIAVWGTENGVQITGAVANVRDGAVITAGLVFGSPAGIIAGLIGGIERWFAVYWGIGSYTRVACSVSTALAGFYSAALRKYMFDDETPSAALALVTGIVMEVFHLSMVFLTNLSDVQTAMNVVKACTLPMVPTNGAAVMFSVFAAKLLTHEKNEEKKKRTISESIQIGLLISVLAIFAITTVFNYRMQSEITDEQVTNQLFQSILDIESDVVDASGNDLLILTRSIAEKVNDYDLNLLAKEFDVSEISIIGKDGIIIKSTNPEYLGFDMRSGDQSSEFLCLLNGTKEYVQAYGRISSDSSIFRKYAGVATNEGFVQVGYGPEEFQDDIAEKVKLSAKNKHIGETGYMVIADHELNIVSAPAEHLHSTIADYGFDINAPADTLNDGIIDGEEVKFVYSEGEGYYFISILPVEEGYKVRSVATYVNVFMEILAFAALFIMIYNLIKATVVSNMNRINTSLARIIDGDLDEVVEVNEVAEFAELSNDINLTVDKLKEYIAEAKARLDAEIDYAKNIQENALPHAFPNDNKYEIYALMDPAKGVGGDFYDFYKTTRHGVNFLIADVSGKGIPGAMFMMRAKSELHTLTETGIPVNDVFTYGNERLCEGNDAGMFVTAWEGNINLETGEVHFANAGHNPPVIMRADGTCEYIRGKVGFVLAGMEGVQYKLQDLQMNPGDILFLYTDGVVEAANIENELYGEDRLLACLQNMDRSQSMEYLCCEVIGDVGRFVGDAEQFDDITMLALRYKGYNKDDHQEAVSTTDNIYSLSGKQRI